MRGHSARPRWAGGRGCGHSGWRRRARPHVARAVSQQWKARINSPRPLACPTPSAAAPPRLLTPAVCGGEGAQAGAEVSAFWCGAQEGGGGWRGLCRGPAGGRASARGRVPACTTHCYLPLPALPRRPLVVLNKVDRPGATEQRCGEVESCERPPLKAACMWPACTALGLAAPACSQRRRLPAVPLPDTPTSHAPCTMNGSRVRRVCQPGRHRRPARLSGAVRLGPPGALCLPVGWRAWGGVTGLGSQPVSSTSPASLAHRMPSPAAAGLGQPQPAGRGAGASRGVHGAAAGRAAAARAAAAVAARQRWVGGRVGALG